MITVLRPDLDDPPAAPLDAAPRGALPELPVIGLIANGKPLAVELLSVLASEIGAQLGHAVEVELLEKPSAAYEITPGQADALAARCHVAIAGLGD